MYMQVLLNFPVATISDVDTNQSSRLMFAIRNFGCDMTEMPLYIMTDEQLKIRCNGILCKL